MNKAFKILSLSFVLLLGTVFFAFGTSAANENGILYSVSGGEATVTGFSEEITEALVIPSTLGGYPVTAIGDSAFEYQWDMPSVVVPEGVRTIGSQAFRCCYALEEVTLPSTLTFAGISAFASCEILRVNHPDLAKWVQIDFDGMHATPVYWDDDEEDPLTEIYFGDSTEPIRDVVIPEGVTRIGTWVFGNNETIESLVIPDSVTEIGERAFYDCGKLLTVDFGEGLERIGEFAFDGCENLGNFTLPDSLLTIGDWAFSSNTVITEVTVPDKVEVISLGAFSYCTALETVNIGAGVETIGQQAFYRAGLTEVIIPDNVIAIDLRAFQECKELETVVIGDGVTTVADKVFYDCTALKNLTIGDSLTSYPENFLKLQDKKESDYIPDDWLHIEKLTVGDGLTALPTEVIKREYLKEIVIGDGVTAIPKNTFTAFSKLVNVSIGDGVTVIGESAFENCSALENVDVGDGVETISRRAFALCRKLKSFRIPAATVTIGETAFGSCVVLENVEFEEGNLRTIGESAFVDCHKLNSVEFYDGLETIGDHAFDYCYKLESVEIPGTVNLISSYAFARCSALSEVTLNEGVEYITHCAFYNNGNLTTINLPISLIEIQTYAFSNCDSLTSLDLSAYANLDLVGYGAFENCTSLSTIILPTHPLYLSSNTFYNTSYYNNEENWTDGAFIIGCHFFEYYYETVPEIAGRYIIPDGIKSIAQDAFALCLHLRSIVVPKSVKIIGMSVFDSAEVFEKVFYLSNEADWNDIEIEDTDDFAEVQIIYNYVICYHGTTREDAGTEPSCTTPGFTVGVACSLCGEWLSGHKVIPPSHNDASADGVCDSCGETVSDILLDVPKTISNTNYFAQELRFVAPRSGEYILKSFNGNGADPYAVIYDANGEEIGYNDDHENENGEYVYDFKLTVTLEKGREYLWKVQCYSAHSFDIVLTYNCKHTDTTQHIAVDATCTSVGYTAGVYCNGCETWLEGHEETPVIEHNHVETITPATLTQNGEISNVCSCGDVESSTVIYRPDSFTLSKTEYTYNGNAKKPTVTVADTNGNELVKDADYTLSYEKGRKNPGRYTVTLTFTGKYSGTKVLEFTVKPRKVADLTAKQTISTITLSWSECIGADGYRVYKYNKDTEKYEKIADVTETSYKVKSLKSGTKYKFKVRAYVKDDGTIYGNYSDVLETATKTKTPEITSAKSSSKGKATVKWSDVSGESKYQLYYATSKNGTYKRYDTYDANDADATVSGLTSGKTYYFKVRTYKNTDGGKVYSSYSAVKSVKVK